MNDVRPTLVGVFALFAALNLAKCDPSRAFSFHPKTASAGNAPSCCACAAGCERQVTR